MAIGKEKRSEVKTLPFISSSKFSLKEENWPLSSQSVSSSHLILKILDHTIKTKKPFNCYQK